MRQKVSKDRSQGGGYPLGHPPPFLACPLRKFDPSHNPLRLFPRLECPAAPGQPAGGTLQRKAQFSRAERHPGPGLPRQRVSKCDRRIGKVVLRRRRRVQLVVNRVGRQCPLPGALLRPDHSAESQPPCERLSVALPPGIGRKKPWLRKNSLRVPSGTRPRASARAAPVRCITSATTGSAGRRSRREAMPTAWASATLGSTRRTVVTMRSVFRCVASRNRVPSGTARHALGGNHSDKR